MGLASDAERAEFERLCKEYPELLAARRRFEDKLEGYASENAEPPPPEVKAKVLEAIGVGGGVGREDFEGDVAFELCVGRAVDLAHAAGAEGGEDAVVG